MVLNNFLLFDDLVLPVLELVLKYTDVVFERDDLSLRIG